MFREMGIILQIENHITCFKNNCQTFEYLGVGSRSNTVFSFTKMEGRWKLTGWGTKQDSLWNRGENRENGKKDIFQKYEVF